jgi:hypothetical protein
MQLLIMKETKGAHEKGDIVEIRASGTPFGGKEPNIFVLVKVPDVPMTAYRNYNRAWERQIGFEVVGSDASTDTHRLKLSSELISGTDGIVTHEEAESFIESWGGTVFSADTNEIVFDISIYDALVSTAFWEVDVSGAVFTEVSYDQATGIHRISVDYSALGNNPTYVEGYVERLGLDIVSHENRVLVYDANRAVVRTAFQDDIKEKLKKQVRRRRYCVAPAVVDSIIANGGTITTDETTMLNYIQDKVG